MKSKKQKDVDSKKKHIEQQKTVKSQKRGTPNLSRSEGIVSERKSFLIFTEGKNTEKSYFEQFRIPTVEIEIIGVGRSTFSLVEYAIPIIKQKNEERLKSGKSIFDEIWCVFDADPQLDAPKQLTHFKNAIDLAMVNNIQVAYSNQAFEYWLLLHFEDHQGGSMHRDNYNDKLNYYLKPLGCFYDGKNAKMVSEDFFNQLLVIVGKNSNGQTITRQDKAIQRAKKIFKFHTENGTSPAKAESSTTVFELVGKLKNN